MEERKAASKSKDSIANKRPNQLKKDFSEQQMKEILSESEVEEDEEEILYDEKNQTETVSEFQYEEMKETPKKTKKSATIGVQTLKKQVTFVSLDESPES